MGNKFTIVLDSIDLGQLLDGLTTRAEAWRKTAEFVESGYSADDSFICEECTDAEEATKIAEHFKAIAKSIERQVGEQGGWWNASVFGPVLTGRIWKSQSAIQHQSPHERALFVNHSSNPR
jgi:hypothetical protein